MPRGQYDRSKTKEQRAAEKATTAPKTAAPAEKTAKAAKGEKPKRAYNRKVPKADPGQPESAQVMCLGRAVASPENVGSVFEIERYTQVIHTLNNGGNPPSNPVLIKAVKILGIHLDAATIRAEAALLELEPKGNTSSANEAVHSAPAATHLPPAAPVAPVVRSFNPPPVPPASA